MDDDVSAPDGGFGWVVVFCSLCISVVVDGTLFSQGLFLPHYRSAFGADTGTTSAITAVISGAYLIFGPIFAGLANTYGCRKVAICGSVMSTIALATAPLHKDVYSMIFIFGLLCGTGFGMMMLPAIVMVGYYFDKRRALATGIACAGTGIGTFAYAPLLGYLLGELGWRGALWVLAGLTSLGVFFAMFYRPLVRQRAVHEETIHEDWRNDDEDISDEKSMNTISRYTESSHSVDHLKVTFKPSQERSKIDGDTFDKQNRGYSLLGPSRSLMTTSKSAENVISLRKTVSETLKTNESIIPPLQKRDVFYSGSLKSIHLSRVVSTGNMPAPSSSADGSLRVFEINTSKSRSSKRCEVLNVLFGFYLLKYPIFNLYITCNFLGMLGLLIPFIYLPDHMAQIGKDKVMAEFMLEIIGVTNIIGRIAAGCLADIPCVSPLLLKAGALMTAGVATFCFSHFPGEYEWMFYIYAGVFGIGFAVFVSLRTIIIVDILGIDRLTSGFGLTGFVSGVSQFLGSPIAGVLYDKSGEYRFTFYMSGASIFLAGATCLVLWCSLKLKTKLSKTVIAGVG